MATQATSFWRTILRRQPREAETAEPVRAPAPNVATAPPIEIEPDDPVVSFFQHASGVVDLTQVHFESPAVQAMRDAGIELVVPLISQGELIGLLNLGPRLSQQDYSTDDRTLLSNLATQAAPAVRVAQLVREQQIEAQERERIEQELRVARLIQQTLLPKAVPQLEGWQVAAYYRPAREVGGDFYDFIELNDGRLGIVVGDVTDKGVPAALVMATTRSILRVAAMRSDSPGEVLRRVNDLLCPDIPPNMFVTCLYAILDPTTGVLRYANAGHDTPYRRRGNDVAELRATGMPLGLMNGMQYEEKETSLEPRDRVLFYSDGLVEAHDPQREMFGFPRLRGVIAEFVADRKGTLVDFLLTQLHGFTGPHWEQEDDITLVTLERGVSLPKASDGEKSVANAWQTLAEFSLPSQEGNERLAIQRVEEAVEPLRLEKRRLEGLKTAVGEATMNAMEHGNKHQPEVPVDIRVRCTDSELVVQITDQGEGGEPIVAQEPDLEAKLADAQTPRGWGLFLIKKMVDDMRVISDERGHVVELVLHLGGSNGSQTV